MPEGFVSKDESIDLRKCLLEISACKIPNLYCETEGDMLRRCGNHCMADRCFTEHDARDIYAIHSRIPQKPEPAGQKVSVEGQKVSEPKKQAIVDRVKEVKAWMS